MFLITHYKNYMILYLATKDYMILSIWSWKHVGVIKYPINSETH